MCQRQLLFLHVRQPALVNRPRRTEFIEERAATILVSVKEHALATPPAGR
jgi:hypothetical protein